MVFEEGRVPVKSEKAYRAVVRAAFAARRKTLENNLKTAFKLTREQVQEFMQEAGIPEGVRGETLSPEIFARLADILAGT